MSRNKLTWGSCGSCGGDLPVIDSDNADFRLPQRLKHRGECPGYDSFGICGAYEGWDTRRIERYVRRNGVKVS